MRIVDRIGDAQDRHYAVAFKLVETTGKLPIGWFIKDYWLAGLMFAYLGFRLLIRPFKGILY